MLLPFNQNCTTYGQGPAGILLDDCGELLGSDTAGLVAAGLGIVGILAALHAHKSPFAAALVALSFHRVVWGVPTPTPQKVAALLFISRAAVSWQTSLVTWGHLLYSKSGFLATTLYIGVSYVYVAAAWALGVTSVACYATGTQPTAAYLAFDCIGVAIGTMWFVY
jgi:hypothetical protein